MNYVKITSDITDKGVETKVILVTDTGEYLIPATYVSFERKSFDEFPTADIRVRVSKGEFLLPTNLNESLLEYIKGCEKLSKIS